MQFLCTFSDFFVPRIQLETGCQDLISLIFSFYGIKIELNGTVLC